MVDYASMVTNKTGTFPNVAAKNASSAGGTDGTEYVAAILNDLWGFWQDVLSQATQTPNGVPEASGTSQKRGALQMSYSAPGDIVFDFIAPGSGTYGAQAMSWGAATGGPPARYQYRRVLVCTGQFVQASLYPDLAAAIYCGDANNATANYCYYTSDAGGTTRSTASKNYIKLPDMRGMTLRVYDHGAIHDPQGATRGAFGEIASLQLDAMQGHYHNQYNSQAGAFLGASYTGSQAAATAGVLAIPQNIKEAATDGANGPPRTSSETRMYNFSCNGGIRY